MWLTQVRSNATMVRVTARAMRLAALLRRRRSGRRARMYEARPGVWISTYDCITDEGYGRWRPCSAGGGKAGR
jgi:hypothetical protein